MSIRQFCSFSHSKQQTDGQTDKRFFPPWSIEVRRTSKTIKHDSWQKNMRKWHLFFCYSPFCRFFVILYLYQAWPTPTPPSPIPYWTHQALEARVRVFQHRPTANTGYFSIFDLVKWLAEDAHLNSLMWESRVEGLLMSWPMMVKAHWQQKNPKIPEESHLANECLGATR